MKNIIHINKQHKQNITDSDRLNILALTLKQYNIANEEETAVIYFEPDPDDTSPNGYFAIETPDFFITADTITELCDRIIDEQADRVLPKSKL